MVLRINALSRSAAALAYQQPRFVDTARQAIEAERLAKASSAREASRGVQDAQAMLRIGDGSLEIQSQLASRIQELAIQGANAGIPQEARDAISGELGALQAEFARIGSTSTMGATTLENGGQLSVIASDSGSLIEQTLPSMGPTASSLSGVDSAPSATAISLASSALSSTLSARAQLGAFDNQFSRARSNLAQSMENHTQALARLNATNPDKDTESPLAQLRAELRARLQTRQAS